MIVNPPGISAKPDCCAVYPSSVCMNKGRSRVLGEGAVAEQMQINDWVLARPFPVNDEQQRRRRDERKGDDEVRFEPVIALAFVQNHLQRSEAEGNES